MELLREGDIGSIGFPSRCDGTFAGEFAEFAGNSGVGELRKLTIDLADTQFVDSASIGQMVRLARAFRDRGAVLALKNLCDDLAELFADTGLDLIFCFDTDEGLDEARIDIFEDGVAIRLTIKTETVEDVCILHLGGVMNHPMGSRFFKQQFLLTMATHKKIVLDFEELTFFDSLSVSVVLNMNKLLKETGGSLRAYGANYIVEDMFQTLNISEVIPLSEDINAVLENWDQPSW